MKGFGKCSDCIWFNIPEGCNVERDSYVCSLNKNLKEELKEEKMNCVNCGRELTIGDTDFLCIECKRKIEEEENSTPWQPMVFRTGWVCPRCGSVYGPSETECTRCNSPRKLEVTF